MSSNTDPPPSSPSSAPPPPTESEPLLGRPGDATQKPDAPMYKNLYLGTGWLAQLGAVLLLLTLLPPILTHGPLLPLLTPHPVLQSLGVFTTLQSVLILQPTTTPLAKTRGQRAHFGLHLVSLALFAAGTTLIQVNKHVNHLAHFHSAHAYLGVATLALLTLQYAFGLTIWAIPSLWGGEARAKALWKYHRRVGYGVVGLLLVTVAAAVKTDYNRDVWGVRLWAVLLAEGLVVVGLVPRVHLGKLGWGRRV
ncbi:cytochrome b ascorbate-dependent protein 3 [Staphylotrichum tortipilum]|uniref:Cytochrome b ascorbate-dependent protein 3 n=1 Tax=Staphylotrichum tortipilum TaxID=2831512 RepID=A0AAN6MGZ3_9PEZI|nr:cytochrome b ascorbate-dependent protein 3 [Staphylotrichum longicolle]